jgi:hypothetical protein
MGLISLLLGTPALIAWPVPDSPRTPVGHLSHSDGIDTLVNPGDTLLPVNVHEHRKGTLRSDSGRGLLVSGDLDRLHAGAETW